METRFLKDEVWYGGGSRIGTRMPLTKKVTAVFDLRINPTPNQAAALFLSNRGRYIYGEQGFQIQFNQGRMEWTTEGRLVEGFENLRGAYLAAAKHFPPQGQPAGKLFERPIYNTWIELTFYQEQQAVLDYANQIIAAGLPTGTLMIDDGWSTYYGDWQFDRQKFPQPEQMIRQLHQLGFEVMLWVCPFVTPDTLAFRTARDQGLLVRQADGKPLVVEWWNGYSAVLDLSNPAADVWLTEQLAELQAIGIDGFKFDAGDSVYYGRDNQTYGSVSPNQQSLLWAQLAARYPYNELRVSFNAGGLPLLQRLCDKNHDWGNNGIASLVPDSLLAGLIGSPYVCPDMIGGGEYLNFAENVERLDHELFIRHAQIAALLPAMQFSAGPWRILEPAELEQIRQAMELRRQYQERILELVDESSRTGEPIIRYMEYEFPNQGLSQVIDQYMLGSKLLVAPICEKGKTGRKVHLPAGQWRYQEKLFEGGKEVELTVGENGLIILERQP